MGLIPFSLMYIILWTGAFTSIWTLSFAFWQLLMWVYLIVIGNSKLFILPTNFYLKLMVNLLPMIIIILVIIFNKGEKLRNKRFMMFLLIWIIFAAILYTLRSAEYLIFNLIFPISVVFILFIKDFFSQHCNNAYKYVFYFCKKIYFI